MVINYQGKRERCFFPSEDLKVNYSSPKVSVLAACLKFVLALYCLNWKATVIVLTKTRLRKKEPWPVLKSSTDSVV